MNGADLGSGNPPGLNRPQQVANPLEAAKQGAQNLGAQGRAVILPAGQQCLADLRVIDLFQSVQGRLLHWRGKLRPQDFSEAQDIFRLRSRSAAQQLDR